MVQSWPFAAGLTAVLASEAIADKDIFAVQGYLVFIHLADKLDQPDNRRQAHGAAESMYHFFRVLQDLYFAFDHQIDRTAPGNSVQISIVSIKNNNTHLRPPYLSFQVISGQRQKNDFCAFGCRRLFTVQLIDNME
ncbi:MAG: hypothetical protein R6U55_02530 [Desulfovermiculus sp.]